MMTEYSEAHWNDLIDQYQNGTISESDRFALEKKALDDPFLFDALQGYALYNDQNTAPENKGTKLFTLPRIAAAASLVFLVSMVFLMKTNDIDTSSTNDQIAMSLPEKEINTTIENVGSIENTDEKVTEAPVTTDPIKTTKREPVKKEKTHTSTTPAKEKTDTKSTPPLSKVRDQTPEVNRSVPNKEEEEQDIVSAEKRTLEKAHSNKTTSSAGTNAQSAKQDAEIVYDASKKLVESDTDGTADIGVLSDLDIKSKNKKPEAPSLYYIVEPLIGKADFDEYVQQRIQQRSDLKQNPTQQIVIEFLINKNGEIGDFIQIIEHNECSECGSFAINILQNSGVWKTVPAGNEGRARYTFQF